MKGAFATFKLKDLNELQDLVAAHLESVEPGLRVLDARVLLGETTVDLVGLDKESGLVLMALGFEADDDMLLRALDAYSWCLESPDAVRRLYPTARLSTTDPPRLLVIAERVPDAFLRKLRHLRMQRVDCLEFSFGLRFDHVGSVRGTEPAGGAAMPKPPAEPMREAPGAPERLREASETRAAADLARAQAVASAPQRPPVREEIPESVPIPSSGTGGSRWRRAGLSDGGHVDEWKAKVVRDYLQREFPTSVIYDFYAHDRAGQMFHLQDSYGDVIHAVAVAEQFLGEHAEAEVRAFFDTHKLGRVLRQAGQAQVTVTTSGVRIERA